MAEEEERNEQPPVPAPPSPPPAVEKSPPYYYSLLFSARDRLAPTASSCYSLLSSPCGYLGVLFLALACLPLLIDPVDVIPLLPHRASKAILHRFQKAEDLLPKYVGSAGSFTFRGSCFLDSQASLKMDDRGEHGGGTLTLKLKAPKSRACTEVFVFGTPYQATWNYYLVRGKKTMDFSWTGQTERDYVKQGGVSLFIMASGMRSTVGAFWHVFPLFTASGWGEGKNIEFLKDRMRANFVKRPEAARVARDLNPDDIHSGDLIVVSKIRGIWGAFQSLQKWVTGSFAGHVAVFIRDPQGKLWVAESGRRNEKGEEIIDVVEWEEWWSYELKEDKANPHIALLPLRGDLRAKFNRAAAWDFAQSMKGKPYGYQNLLFSWIDTARKNYPDPVDDNLVASFMTIVDRFLPQYTTKLWKEALNKRLKTQDLDVQDIMAECQKRGMSFGELLSQPEQDNWVYHDGNSFTCVALVMKMYEYAGLFDPIKRGDIQATEFTVKDGYQLQVFESTTLPKWCNKGDPVKLRFCQILGNYRMELPGFNTVPLYPHMNEKCPSMPPNYERPSGC